TPAPTQEPEPEYFVLSFVGDCTFACDDSQNSSPYNFNTVVGDNFAFPFEYVADIFTDDELTLINLECAITDYPYAREKTFTFAANPKYLALFEEGSIEFANLANNHSYDYNEQGYADTKEYLDSINAAYSCHNEIIVFTTKNGLTIGVYATDYDTYPIDPTEAISSLKALSPDLIIYAPHWGIEGAYTLADNQIINARKAIDAGADIVFGTHPHVLQRIEEYNGKYIFYSLGNFIFGGNTAPRDRDTAILQVTVERAPDGTVSLVNYEAIPCALSSEAAYNNYQPIPYAEGSVEYDRAMSKLLGTFAGPNLVVDYSFMHKSDTTPTPETKTEAPTNSPESVPSAPPSENTSE
ncbi:MAG: CapA family protein, partial [Oscillospiraceae bacterium]|nr:CapA family protein [Oscillospiraceae bacterium]